MTHVLNTATEHVVVNPEKYPAYDIKYHGFHVDDLPEANISRYELPFCDISVLTSTPLEDQYLVFFGPFWTDVSFLLPIQILPHDNQGHRPGGFKWRPHCCQLCHGVEQVFRPN